MASKACSSSLALFLILNILFSPLVSARRRCRHRPGDDYSGGRRGGLPWGTPRNQPGGPGGLPWGRPGRPGGPGGLPWGNPPRRGPYGPGGGPWDGTTPPRGSAPSTPPVSGGSNGSAPSTPRPPGGSTTPSSSGGSCPREALKFSECTNVLNGLFNVTLGQQPVTPCCTLFNGLVDLEAASCLCTALKSNVMGTNRNIPISLSVILNACSRQVPREFNCA